MKYGYKVTKQGRELLAALLATGKELEIVRVAVGSGKVSEDTDLADMTDLVEYVAEGKIAQRRHVDNVLYLTVQYASNDTPGLPAFYLGEFIVWAKHPTTGGEVVLLYATLGDYTQLRAQSINVKSSLLKRGYTYNDGLTSADLNARLKALREELGVLTRQSASATTRRSGLFRTISSVWVPIEPVEPNIAMFFI